ncbi:NAD(+)/NADH kinase [bacterium]|nr:NAD(+)/NADH kinase [candidate division CSSED10-310 bacterium]
MNNPSISVVALFIKPNIPEICRLGRTTIDWLRERGIQVRVSAKTLEELGTNADGIIGGNDENLQDVGLALVLGGDGTILWVARKVAHLNIPVLSFNMGNLGFLAAYGIDHLFDVLEATICGRFQTVSRMMLEATHIRGEHVISRHPALNDVVVNKRLIPRLIELETAIDNETINTYLCDGLIICTPTGSTAYSLSAGGPILSPDLDALAITPICPHTLTHRPIVIAGNSTVTIQLISKDRKAFLTLDGQVNDSICCGDRIEIRKSPHCARIIVDPESRFFRVLNRKLKWGYR